MYEIVAQLVEQGPLKPKVGGSIPPGLTCGCSSVVEQFLAKEQVKGSSPFSRSVQPEEMEAEHEYKQT